MSHISDKQSPFTRRPVGPLPWVALEFREMERICEEKGLHQKAISLAEQMRADVAAMDWTHREATSAQPVQLELTSRMLQGSQAKTAYALRLNCERMIGGNAPRTLKQFKWRDKEGIQHEGEHWIAETPENLNSTGFLTLTVGDYVCSEHGQRLPAKEGQEFTNLCPVCLQKMKFVRISDADEANRRFNNLNRRVLGMVFSQAVVVTERHKSKDIHFHALGLIAGGQDIRSGFDFDAVSRRNYRSASDALRAIWSLLREKLPEYGFGRAELLPVKKSGEAVACYVSKYIEKNVCNRLAEDAHKKLVRYLGWNGTQLKANDVEWATKRADTWWAKTSECAGLIGAEVRTRPESDFPEALVEATRNTKFRPKIHDGSPVAEALGPRWAMLISSLWTKLSDEPVNRVDWPNYQTREWVRNQLAARAGREWCHRSEAERCCVIAGEVYTATEARLEGYSQN